MRVQWKICFPSFLILFLFFSPSLLIPSGKFMKFWWPFVGTTTTTTTIGSLYNTYASYVYRTELALGKGELLVIECPIFFSLKLAKIESKWIDSHCPELLISPFFMLNFLRAMHTLFSHFWACHSMLQQFNSISWTSLSHCSWSVRACKNQYTY